MPLGPPGSLSSLPSRIRSILDARGLALAEAARRSRSLFREDHRFHVPPNLYHLLEHRDFSPSIHQVFALSRLSDFRLVDWLAVFGLVLDDIPRLQAVLPARRTTLIDANVYDERSWMLAFEEIVSVTSPESLAPLGERVRLGVPRRHSDARPGPRSRFLYAKVGCRDAFAFPDLLPGSIVRAVRFGESFRNIPIGRQGAFFLIEHAGGVVCSRLHLADRARIVLSPTHLSFAQVELRLGKEARILGAVDFELRPTAFLGAATVPRNLHRFWTPEPLIDLAAKSSFQHFLRRARLRSGLTFREAADKSVWIARSLESEEFLLAAGSLSEYESKSALPRDIHKWFSLATVYSLDAWESLSAAGFELSETGKDVMPDHLLGRTSPENGPGNVSDSRIPSIVAEFPYSFGQAAAEFFNLDHLSLRNLFWMGRPRPSFHPYLADAAVLIVDRRKKRVRTLPEAPLWAQPLYLLLGRDQQYVCASCLSENGRLVMRPFSDGFERPLRFKSPDELEIVGRVVGILRRTLRRGSPS
jgi:hypothetical protein